LFTVVPADKAAILPPSIPFTRGVVLPFALEAAVCCLSGTKVTELGGPLPGVTTPALGLPYPTLDPVPARKTIIVYGGSSSVGATTTQLATAAGIKVIAITSARNASLSKSCGAAEVFDYKNPWIVDHVIAAAKASEGFFGIIDVISSPETYGHDLAILEALGGGHLACVHPPPQTAPDNVKAGMIFAVDDAATPVWRDYVTPALQAGKLQCLPEPLVVGKGLEAIQEALKTLEAGVSATKVVVEL
jgi:NADPH:quinone reductase-like Zn-dependent oxidoreductase